MDQLPFLPFLGSTRRRSDKLGFAGHGHRGNGQRAYLDWVVGNAILPAEDTEHTGMQKIDRKTVLELREVASSYGEIQAQADTADLGLNPLGLAANVVPFDISPTGIDQNKTHFEQIYERAVGAMNNAITVFNHAYNSSQLLRRQADSLTEFQRNVEDREADFKNRLIEVFGYPYADDIGAGGTYPQGYDGPDLYHYAYVDPSALLGEDPPPVQTFEVTFTGINVQDDGSLAESTKDVTFHLANSADRLGLVKPATWTGQRRAPGELQLAQSDLVQARARFERTMTDYNNLLAQIEDQADMIQAQYNLNAREINILNTQLHQQQTLDAQIRQSRQMQLAFRTFGNVSVTVANALAESISTSQGTSPDILAPVRGAIRLVGALQGQTFNTAADFESMAELGYQQAQQTMQAQNNITLTAMRSDFAVEQQLRQLEQLVRQEASLRLDLYTTQEAMQQTAGRWSSALARGLRLFEDRQRFQRQTAADVQSRRYKDMAFRIFRNDALQKYRAQFDMAARYVFLAAKAYDYETTLLSSDPRAGQAFLTDIVRARLIGTIARGQPITGQGLADPMARMSQNFAVLRGQLGFDNPDTETDRFSLRQEFFRILPNANGNLQWREILRRHVVANLLDIPEMQRYAIFTSPAPVEPGIVIPFETNVNYGLDFFGWPLGGGDHQYNPGNFATKVRSVGVWFSNYNNLGAGMADSPRVFLIPVGTDVLRSPTGNRQTIREFDILDQLLPVQFPVNAADLTDNPSWMPAVNTLGGLTFADVRRHAAFRAYHDSGYQENQCVKNSRLIGRSVWNTRWMLVIPAVYLRACE